MSHMIESMESRTLLTAAPVVIAADALALDAAGKQAQADLLVDAKLAAVDTKAIKTAALASKPSSVQKASLTAFLKAEAADAKQLQKQITSILSAGTRTSNKLKGALNNLKSHPANTVAQAKALGAATALAAIFSDTVVAGVEANVGGAATALTADSTAVATSIPSSAAAVASFQAHLTSDQSMVSTDAAAIQTSIATLQADLTT